MGTSPTAWANRVPREGRCVRAIDELYGMFEVGQLVYVQDCWVKGVMSVAWVDGETTFYLHADHFEPHDFTEGDMVHITMRTGRFPDPGQTYRVDGVRLGGEYDGGPYVDRYLVDGVWVQASWLAAAA